MLITPSLMHVKTRTSRNRQDDAAVLHASALAEPTLEGIAADVVLSRFDAPVVQQGAEATEWQCVRDDHAAMAEAGEWRDLLEALRFADQERSMASGGRGVARLISEGIRAGLLEALAAQDWPAAQAELLRFEAVLALHPEDYAAAHVLAQAHIDLACAQHDAAIRGQLSRDLTTDSAAHFAAAEELLTIFDPIEEMSPLLAASRYQLVRGIEDGAGICRDWYEDWCDLDPEDALAHATHALHMLPEWFGSLSVFEREARRAVALTEAVTGQAAYAIFHLAAVKRLGDLVSTVDLELFLRGLADYQTATGCQHRANVAANQLTRMVRDYRAAGPAAAWQLTKVRAALSDVLWNRLKEVQLDAWDLGADGVALALGEAFGPALKRGARIVRCGEGMGTRIPRG